MLHTSWSYKAIQLEDKIDTLKMAEGENGNNLEPGDFIELLIQPLLKTVPTLNLLDKLTNSLLI